jgi:hypothetical protein
MVTPCGGVSLPTGTVPNFKEFETSEMSGKAIPRRGHPVAMPRAAAVPGLPKVIITEKNMTLIV